MNKKQSGFTLIELVMVIVILGILAAVAVPKFVDLQDDAKKAAVKGVAGGISSAFATNYAARAVNSTKGVAISGSEVDVSAAIGSILVGGMPSGYSVPAAGSTVNCGTTAGVALSISVTDGANPTVATLICTG